MTDELKIFQAGDKITADETNDNNRYLLGVAQDTSGELQTYIDSQLNSFQNTLNTQISSINTQLAAVNSSITSLSNTKLSATQSKSGNGYCKFSNGIIIQWGQNTVNTADTTITLPTSFTSTSYKVVAMDAAFKATSGHQRISGGATSKTQIKLTSTANSTAVAWYAIGY